ncbi:MAG TPA: tetratricopeptide repeat protein, partial [Alphaproteobacteria bacterium]|nr:tetratricopeptide repeat protein [Alphaproteobacteria bacterium]
MVAAQTAWRAPEARFSVLIADLDGDDANLSQTKHVQRALEHKAKGLRVLREGRALRLGDVGDSANDQAIAVRKGQAWLGDRGADVLVWGEVGKADAVLRLRFLTAEGEGGDAKGHRLGDTLDLPQDFGSDAAEALSGVVLASVLPASEEAGQYLVDRLKPVAARIEGLLATPPPGLPEERLAHVQAAFGLVCSVLGKQIGDSRWLEKAVAAYRAALEVRTRERVPLQWAMTQNNLGTALRTLGEREERTALLEEAVAAYRAALEVYTRERMPLQWGETQNNLGAALWALGEREEGTLRLEQAAAAYSAALQVRTRERVPLDWALTQNDLGTALQALGERERGTVLLKQAAAAFRAALEVYSRERVPLQWAATENNLGNVLRALGEREEGRAPLEEAVAAYRAALEVYTRALVPLDWAMT